MDEISNKEVFKETEFDSSVATLYRIDGLIQKIHSCAILPGLTQKLMYIDLVKRLYVEAQNKFTKIEEKSANEFLERLDTVQIKWSDHMFASSGRNGRISKEYCRAWNEIMEVANEFEIFVMRALDNHNMLMKTAKTGMERFRSGGM